MHHAVTDYMLDIVENSLQAGSSVVTVDLLEDEDYISVCIGDNGSGMSEELLSKVRDPFFTNGKKHENRSVGLGIPFVEQASHAAGGEFDIRSEEGLGSSVFFTFNKSHLDCPPLGDIPGSAISMMMYEGKYELLFNRSSVRGRYVVSRSELSAALGTLEDADAVILARRYITEQENEIA
ncbi:MAG TPA: sensor histidine kinase [Spirochaetota bacterium]